MVDLNVDLVSKDRNGGLKNRVHMLSSGGLFHVEVIDLNSTLVDGRGEKPRDTNYLHFGNNDKRREVISM